MLPLASPVASSARAEPHPIHIHDQLDQAPASSARDQAQARSRRQAQAQEIRDGLRGSAPRIAPKFLYDPAGCDLYERLVQVPEYYLPRVERRILDHHQPGMLQRLPGNAQLIDLGCGDGLKARRWLASGQVSRYVGVDIAGDWLRGALQSHRALYPQIQFDGVITDFSQRLHLPTVLDDPRPSIVWYPGSSIGNFEADEALRLLRQIRAHLRAGDRFILAADAPTDPERMRRAYDDAAGLTAAFDLNVLNVANQVAGTDFDVSAFKHRSFWNDEHHRIEMHLVSRLAQRVSLGDGGVLDLAEDQAIVTEHSYKHPPARVQAWFDAAGFDRVERLGIPGEAYGVWLASIDRDPPGCSGASDGGDDASR